MKLVLINPPTSFEQMYGAWDLSALDTYCPPLGLLYLAGYVRQEGHRIDVVDVSALKWSLQRTIDYVISLKPDLVGITGMTVHIFNANAIAEGLKRNGLSTPIVIGGPHFTATPALTLERFPAIDYGILGEGERTFLELTQKIERREDVRGLAGLCFREVDGKVSINPPRQMIEDLDSLPLPAWDLLPNFPHAYPQSALETKRLPAGSIITSRGCPHKCTFCDRAVFGSTVRNHSDEYTLKMIRHLRDTYGIRDLMILDDNFLLDKRKVMSICDTIIDEKMDLNWYCLSHVRFMTEERLKKIREAGCWIMEVGIESGCERILKLLRRSTLKSEIAEAVSRARKIGIRVKGNFIFGLPTETKESLEETIQFATSIDISLFQQTFLTIWPGCELSENADQYGHSEKDWQKLAHFQISFVPDGLTENDLLVASKKAMRRFYLRPRIVLETLRSMRSLRAIKCSAVSFAAFVRSLFR